MFRNVIFVMFTGLVQDAIVYFQVEAQPKEHYTPPMMAAGAKILPLHVCLLTAAIVLILSR